LRGALAQNPQVAELHEGLILALVFLNRIEEAAQASDEKLRLVQGLLPADYIRSASLWAQVRNWQRSSQALESGLLAHPGNTELTRRWIRFFWLLAHKQNKPFIVNQVQEVKPFVVEPINRVSTLADP